MRISSLGSAWSCDAVNAFEVLDAASTFKVLDAFSTVVMFDRWFILLGKAYLVFRRSSTCFAKVSAWAHNQQKLAFSSRSHCKKVIIKVKVLFHLKNNLERQLYCEQPFHWFYAGIPNQKYNHDVRNCRMKIVPTEIHYVIRLSSCFFITLPLDLRLYQI